MSDSDTVDDFILLVCCSSSFDIISCFDLFVLLKNTIFSFHFLFFGDLQRRKIVCATLFFF